MYGLYLLILVIFLYIKVHDNQTDRVCIDLSDYRLYSHEIDIFPWNIPNLFLSKLLKSLHIIVPKSMCMKEKPPIRS